MLRKIQIQETRCSPHHKFVIVASLYNQKYVDGMLKAAISTLKQAGAKSIQVIRVPGAFEIPCVASKLASNPTTRPHAIICLGVIMRGETVHADYIGETVSRALMQIQLQYHVPLIHEVLLLENEQQAKVRCLDPDHNRGIEAAQTAIQMAKIMEAIEQNT